MSFLGDCPFVNLTASFGCDLSDGAAFVRDDGRLNPGGCSSGTGRHTIAASFATSSFSYVCGSTYRTSRTSAGFLFSTGGDLRSTSAAVAGTSPGAATAAEFCGGRPTA